MLLSWGFSDVSYHGIPAAFSGRRALTLSFRFSLIINRPKSCVKVIFGHVSIVVVVVVVVVIVVIICACCARQHRLMRRLGIARIRANPYQGKWVSGLVILGESSRSRVAVVVFLEPLSKQSCLVCFFLRRRAILLLLAPKLSTRTPLTYDSRLARLPHLIIHLVVGIALNVLDVVVLLEASRGAVVAMR